MGAIYFKDEPGGTNAVAAGVGPGAAKAAGPGTADAEAEAADIHCAEAAEAAPRAARRSRSNRAGRVCFRLRRKSFCCTLRLTFR